jgi:hypothetical protein
MLGFTRLTGTLKKYWTLAVGGQSMKIALILVIAAMVGATGAYATTIDLGLFSVSPQGNFLYNSANDNCGASYAVAGCSMNPTFINLSAYMGDTITVTDVGGLCVYSGTNCTVYPASSSYLGAVWDTNNTLLMPADTYPFNTTTGRLPGAIPSGLPNINTSSLNAVDGRSTTIADDFFLPQANLVVIAPYLVVGTLDSAFADNSLGASPNFGVDITVNTPEPGSATLLLTGVAGLLALRRKFAKRA